MKTISKLIAASSALFLAFACEPLGEINVDPFGNNPSGEDPETQAPEDIYVHGWELSRNADEGFVRFADENLYRACAMAADADGDLLVSLDEAAAVRELDIEGKKVSDLTGLEAFVNLEVFNANTNDIVNADVFSSLHYLRWFDLRNNPDLESFDLTGCNIYFDKCLFDTSEKLHYKTLLRQLNVTWDSDPYSTCAEHIIDTRISSDWSRHNNLVKVAGHTAGEGGKAIVLSGLGWLDVDLEDGSFRRAMDDTYEFLLYMHPTLKSHIDEFDVYLLEYVSESRERFVYSQDDFYEPFVEPLREGYNDWRKAHYLEMKTSVFPNGEGLMIAISMDLHPNLMIVPLRTSGCSGEGYSKDGKYRGMFICQFNLTPTLDVSRIGTFACQDDSFSFRKNRDWSDHDTEINKMFGW